LQTDMCKFESSHKHENQAKSADFLLACSNRGACVFKREISARIVESCDHNVIRKDGKDCSGKMTLRLAEDQMSWSPR